MAVIEAASAGVKDMADGSLRITFEFEPRHAADAFALFGPRGRAVAIAALKDGAAAITSESASEVKEKQQPKGGEWAKLAGMWCADPEFWLFLNHTYPNDDRVENDKEAALSLRVHCDIGSRAELDHDPAALDLFNLKIRRPYMKWMQARGIVR